MADRSARPLDAPFTPEGQPGTDRCRRCDTRWPSAVVRDWLAFRAEYKQQRAPETLDAPCWRREVAAPPARSQKGRRRLGGGVAASSDWDDTSARTGLRGRFICSRAKRTRPSSTHPRMPGSQTAPCTRWQMLSTSWGQLQALTFGAPIVIRRLRQAAQSPTIIAPIEITWARRRSSQRVIRRTLVACTHAACSAHPADRAWPPERRRPPCGHAMHDLARRARSDAQHRRGIARRSSL